MDKIFSLTLNQLTNNKVIESFDDFINYIKYIKHNILSDSINLKDKTLYFHGSINTIKYFILNYSNNFELKNILSNLKIYTQFFPQNDFISITLSYINKGKQEIIKL